MCKSYRESQSKVITFYITQMKMQWLESLKNINLVREIKYNTMDYVFFDINLT